MSERKKKYYLPAEQFFNVMVDAKRRGFATNQLGEAFRLLAEKYSTHRNWIRYQHLRDEIIGECCLACMKSWNNWRPFKDKDTPWDGEELVYDYKVHNNPHSFFTTTMKNHMVNWIMSFEYNQSNIKNEIRLNQGMEVSDGYVEAMKAKEDKKKEKEEAEAVVVDTSGIVW